MAITIKSNPGIFFSVHGDLIFVVYEAVKAIDPVTYPDYKYIADIYVGTDFVARLKTFPRPDNLMGVFNIANTVREYLAATFNPTPDIILSQELGNGESSIAVTVKFGEEYDFTTYTNVTVDSERIYWNHYNGRLIGDLTILADYKDKLLTVRQLYNSFDEIAGTVMKAYPVYNGNKNNFIPALPGTNANASIVIKTYTASGTLIDSQTQSYAGVFNNFIQIFNVSPDVINTVFPGLINPAVVGYYTIRFTSDSTPGPGGVITSIIRFNLVCEARYEVFTLHFLNRFGGFESRDFTKVSRKTIDIEKKEYGKLGYSIDLSGNVSYSNANKVYNETRPVYSSQYKEKMVLNTDILTDNEYLWLADLILSPMVFIEIEDYFIPCVIVSNDYEFKKSINDKLTSLTLNIEFGDQFNAQFR